MKVFFNAISLATLLGSLLINPVSADENAEAFKKIDINGDGIITEHEALAYPELLGAFSDGDDNEDGRLDLDEYSKLEITDE